MTTKNQQEIELQSAVDFFDKVSKGTQGCIIAATGMAHLRTLITAATEASKQKCADCGADMMEVCSGLHFSSANEKCRTHESVEFYKAEAVRLRSEVPEWLPIESAPRDGTEFLGFSPSHGVRSNVSFNKARQDFDIGFSCMSRNWTHWQPLPQPPKSTA